MLERRQLLSVTIDDVGLHYRTAPQHVYYQFNQPVTGEFTADDIVIDHLTTNTAIDRASLELAYDSSEDLYSLSFPGHSNQGVTGMIPDGNFDSIVSELGVPGMVSEHRFSFFFLIADANRDRAVSSSDNAIFEANFMQSNRKFHQGDFNLDGVVNLDDWTILSANFGRQMPEPLTEANSMQAAALSSSTIRLTWTAPGAGTPDGYRIFRSLDGTNFTLLAEVNNSTLSYDDPGLNGGTKYWYRVRPFTNADGNGATTNKVSAVTVLPAPTNVVATAISDTSIAVSWTNNATAQVGFNIYRSESGLANTWTLAGWAEATAESFIDFDLEPNTTYYYYVQAIGSDEDSLPSLVASATTHEGPLGSPTNVSASGISTSTATVAWEYEDSRVDGFRIFGIAPDGTQTVLANNIPANARQRQLSGLRDGWAYNVFVQAFDTGSAQIADSGLESFTTVLPSPTGLAAETPPQDTEITLNWTNAAAYEPGEVGFEVFISEDGYSFGYLATIDPGDAPTYTATDLSTGTGFGFQVFAFRADVSSSAAQIAAATNLPAPSGFSASAANAREVNLSWSDESETEDRFAIQYWKVNDPYNTFVTFAPENATGYTIVGLEPETEYSFEIRAGFQWNGQQVTSAVAEAGATTTDTDECPPDRAPPAGLVPSGTVYAVPCYLPSPIPEGSGWMSAFSRCPGGGGGNPFGDPPPPWPPDTCL
ncbi:MAG TPA: fibronectin type III domain-containing protein, partial [Tepidisphaeraceae bacterium]|nr:fibronectin type III domain-containing protein [Tepidisphaeraceae bacterium]